MGSVSLKNPNTGSEQAVPSNRDTFLSIVPKHHPSWLAPFFFRLYLPEGDFPDPFSQRSPFVYLLPSHFTVLVAMIP